MSLLSWFRRPAPRGVHFSEAAMAWAAPRFPVELRAVAAFVADVLCEQVGLTLGELESQSVFYTDLSMDEEVPEFVMALEEDLCFSIPDADCCSLNTVFDLVSYLHQRLLSSNRIA